MKLRQPNPDGTFQMVAITWGEHGYKCESCREVNLDKPASFAAACVLGSKLITEELVKRQRPVVAQKSKEIEEWAKKAGVFKVGKALPFTMKYVEDEAA